MGGEGTLDCKLDLSKEKYKRKRKKKINSLMASERLLKCFRGESLHETTLHSISDQKIESNFHRELLFLQKKKTLSLSLIKKNRGC